MQLTCKSSLLRELSPLKEQLTFVVLVNCLVPGFCLPALGGHATEATTRLPQVGRLTFQQDLSLWCWFELAPAKVPLEH